MGQVIVEDGVGDESRHAHEAPAGEGLEPGVDLGEVGNRVADAQGLEAVDELVARMHARELGLPLDQQPPHRLILLRIEAGMLRHGPVRRHLRVVAAQIVERGDRVHAATMGAGDGEKLGEVRLPESLYW